MTAWPQPWKFWVLGGRVRVLLVVVAAPLVGLPDLHEGALHRLAGLVGDPTLDVDDLAPGRVRPSLHPREVGVLVGPVADRVEGPLHLGRRHFASRVGQGREEAASDRPDGGPDAQTKKRPAAQLVFLGHGSPSVVVNTGRVSPYSTVNGFTTLRSADASMTQAYRPGSSVTVK